MLIPSIDVMGGKIVQLVQGERKALESDDFNYWINRFCQYPLVQLIDLDAAMGKGDNTNSIRNDRRGFPARLVAASVRSKAQELLGIGAKRVILGSSLIKVGAIKIRVRRGQCAESGRRAAYIRR